MDAVDDAVQFPSGATVVVDRVRLEPDVIVDRLSARDVVVFLAFDLVPLLLLLLLLDVHGVGVGVVVEWKSTLYLI